MKKVKLTTTTTFSTINEVEVPDDVYEQIMKTKGFVIDESMDHYKPIYDVVEDVVHYHDAIKWEHMVTDIKIN